MKKLKKFVLNDSVRLSREEMVAIEGMDFCVKDYCYSNGDLCVLNHSYSNGHHVVTIGVCRERSYADSSGLHFYWQCV